MKKYLLMLLLSGISVESFAARELQLSAIKKEYYDGDKKLALQDLAEYLRKNPKDLDAKEFVARVGKNHQRRSLSRKYADWGISKTNNEYYLQEFQDYKKNGDFQIRGTLLNADNYTGHEFELGASAYYLKDSINSLALNFLQVHRTYADGTELDDELFSISHGMPLWGNWSNSLTLGLNNEAILLPSLSIAHWLYYNKNTHQFGLGLMANQYNDSWVYFVHPEYIKFLTNGSLLLRGNFIFSNQEFLSGGTLRYTHNLSYWSSYELGISFGETIEDATIMRTGFYIPSAALNFRIGPAFFFGFDLGYYNSQLREETRYGVRAKWNF